MAGKIKTGIVKGSTVQESVHKAIALAGDLDFIDAGSTVLVKPNVNSDDPPPATTSPAVLSAVLATLRERRPARIIVGDRSVYWGNTVEYTRATGIYDTARLAGAEVVDLEQAGWALSRPRGATGWGRSINVSKLAREVDYIRRAVERAWTPGALPTSSCTSTVCRTWKRRSKSLRASRDLLRHSHPVLYSHV